METQKRFIDFGQVSDYKRDLFDATFEAQTTVSDLTSSAEHMGEKVTKATEQRQRGRFALNLQEEGLSVSKIALLFSLFEGEVWGA